MGHSFIHSFIHFFLFLSAINHIKEKKKIPQYTKNLYPKIIIINSVTHDAYEILLLFLQNPLTKRKQMFTVMINC